MQEYDVIVVGAGNAAFCAALAAQEEGALVLMLVAAPEAESAATADLRPASIRVGGQRPKISRRWSPI